MCIRGGEGIRLLILKPIPDFILQGEWEELQSNGISWCPIEFDCVALRKEITKMDVWVLKGVSTKLVSPH